jgi:hypothetical protein
MKMLRTVLFLTLLFAGFTLPNTVTTAGSGNWSSTIPGAPWSGGNPPLVGDDVIIANGCTVTIDQAVTVASLTVGQGSSGILTFDGIAARAVVVSGNVTVATGGTFVVQSTGAFINTLSIGGDLTNNGTFDMSLNTTTTICNVTFAKNGDQNVSGTPTLKNFYKIILPKTLPANKVLGSVSTSFASPFTFTAGTWEQTAGTLTNNGSAVSIGTNGGMIFSVESNYISATSLANQGILTVNTSGTITIGTANNSLGTSNGTMTLTSGKIKVNGRMSMTTAGSTVINGANISIDPSGITGATTSAFECSGAAASLTFSLGSLTLINPYPFATSSRGTGRDIKLTSSGSMTIGGGTIYLGDGKSAWTLNGAGYLIQSNVPLNNLTLQKGNRSDCDVYLSAACTVNGVLTLNTGYLTTTSANLLTLGASATISGGNTNSFVIGPLARTVATASPVIYDFPIGKGSAYRPLQLSLTQSSATSTVYTAEQFNSAPASRTLPGDIDNVSSVRYFNIAKGTGASVTSASVKLSYDTDDGVTDATALKIAKDDGSGNWVNLGGSGTANTTGTITSTINFTSFSDFVLAFNTGRVLNLTALIEGFFYGTSMVSDIVTVELHNTFPPYALIDSDEGVLNTSGFGTFTFRVAVNGTPYYIAVKHRNVVETWSAGGNTFSASYLEYNFTDNIAKAYTDGSILPMIQKNGKWCIKNGDVNHDGSVDITDLIAIDNDASSFVTGYVDTDCTGDDVIDLSDLIIADNHNSNFVVKQVP